MALENVMRVDGGHVVGIGGTIPETYPASHVMMSDGETSVEDTLDELNESVDELESNWESVTLPFTPRKTGILSCLMRCNSQGRVYILLNGASATIVDGYNIAGGYVNAMVGVTKNVQVSQTGSSNLQTVYFSYKSL